MIIMFGFKHNHTPDSNSISIKLLELKEVLEKNYDVCKFTIKSSNNLFQSIYYIDIFNLPDKSELEVKKIIEDFILIVKENTEVFSFCDEFDKNKEGNNF